MQQSKMPAGSACSLKDMLNILTVMEEAGLPMLCVSINDGAVARRPLGEALAEAVKVGAPETCHQASVLKTRQHCSSGIPSRFHVQAC